MCQSIPWHSFQALRSLTYGIYYRKSPQKQTSSAEVDQSVLTFTLPSRLPQLKDLHVTYRIRVALKETEDLDMYLGTIYLHDINRTSEDPNSFPSLRTFYTKVHCEVSIDAPLARVLNEEKLAERVADSLPAIFRVGGRRERHGWITTIVPSVLRVYLEDF